MDRFEQTQQAATAALTRGDWVGVPGKANTLRRTVVHETPAFAIEYGWWRGETYESHEFITFLFGSRDRVPTVFYKTHRCPWTNGGAQKVSFKKALEILVSGTSPVHE